MWRSLRSAWAAAGAAVVLVGAVPAASAAPIRAGAAVVDATWHVGASAGQYASSRAESTEFDPSVQSFKNAPSYGVQSRLQARAIVVQEAGGQKVAIVKNDLYIPQDLLWRRTAQLLEARGIGIGERNLVVASTHDHSSPYYTSTGAGAWTFQDVFDLRAFEYYAHRMAEAVAQADARLVDVRVSAATGDFDKTPRNALGPAIADDGTPAGFPDSYTDRTMSVVRFDRADGGAPVATLFNFSLHGEFLNGNDLISADWVGPLQRMTDARTGGVTVVTQNAVGNSEPERSSYHPASERLEFTHREYGQAEYAAHLMSDAAVGLWRDAGAGKGRVAPFADGPVRMEDRWFPGPLTHPYPAVSNCRTDGLLSNPLDPKLPAAGLPDCAGPSTAFDQIGVDYPVPREDPGVTTQALKAAGIPVPDNLGVVSFGALEEDVDVHLQAFRIGGILMTVCSCEQWADQSRNIKTRLDTTPDDEWHGFDYAPQCRAGARGAWICPNPREPGKDLPPISDERFRRMRAQVNNCANGWNALANVRQAESEPADPKAIRGNYTCDDTSANAAHGYPLVVPISMADDYNGYIATYREYQRGDHYRKALTGWGPHSSDYMATRLVWMGRALNGGTPLDALSAAAASDPTSDADSPPCRPRPPPTSRSRTRARRRSADSASRSSRPTSGRSRPTAGRRRSSASRATSSASPRAP